MTFIEKLNHDLDEYHLLKHPFYRAWNQGLLSIDVLIEYAREYYHHVAAFPRYISGIHSRCEDLPTRQVLLGNLIDEEKGDDNHPELWKRFATGLGCPREDLKTNSDMFEETKQLVDGYFDLVEEGYAEGLGALYGYERQTPSIAKSKLEGLEKFYGITDEETGRFFRVHMEADEWHSQECANLMEKLSDTQKERAHEGALKGAKLLWRFLDRMMIVYQDSLHEAPTFQNAAI